MKLVGTIWSCNKWLFCPGNAIEENLSWRLWTNFSWVAIITCTQYGNNRVKPLKILDSSSKVIWVLNSQSITRIEYQRNLNFFSLLQTIGYCQVNKDELHLHFLDVESYAKKNPVALMRALDTYLQKRKGVSTATGGPDTFRGIADLESDEEN